MFPEIIQPIAELEKRIAENNKTIFLPKRSLNFPATATPIIEPTKAQPTYQPVLTSFKLNWAETLPIVPEITAVS